MILTDTIKIEKVKTDLNYVFFRIAEQSESITSRDYIIEVYSDNDISIISACYPEWKEL